MMTVLVVPTGRCNLDCAYCFESPGLRKNRKSVDLNLKKIEQTLAALHSGQIHGLDFGLHGGECTTIDLADLQVLLKMIYAITGKSAIQTNGYKLSAGMINLFQTYRTCVSISCDGPAHLNTLRGPDPSDAQVTRQYNETLNANIKRLRNHGIAVTVMCVLHKENAGDQTKLMDLGKWLLWLSSVGINKGRFNALYSNNKGKRFQLSDRELSLAYRFLFDFVIEAGLQWMPFGEMCNNLLGCFCGPCLFGKCDYFNTLAVTILPDGSLGNCDRTFSRGFEKRSPMHFGITRYKQLVNTQCKGCIYWSICHGGCPASAIDADWRNKTRFCRAIYETYEHIAKRIKLIMPNIKLTTDEAGLEPFRSMAL
jgi:radical SAM protein with 4Fe4S-binding SPASM domain